MRQFRTFFSHKYKSTAANLYFWSILSEAAVFQFRVDEGNKPTNVTRLERMIRNSDAFVGIFSVSEEDGVSREQLLKQSAYFRLETDLAIRSGRPTLLYIDERYRPFFPRKMPRLHIEYFDAQEINSGTTSPSHNSFVAACLRFREEIGAHKNREDVRRDTVGEVFIVLAGNAPESVYTADAITAIREALENNDIREAELLRFPNQKNALQLARLDEADWVVADVGSELFRTGLVGYMHGRFIPMMRLFHEGEANGGAIGEHRCLHAGIEKGYDSDLVRWKTSQSLAETIAERTRVLLSEPTLIADATAADTYFRRASLRKEAVFLSYSGTDRDLAELISGILKGRFQDVFNYKDGASIRPGQPWLEEIDASLRRATIGVQLLSPAYLASPHCREEARIMNNRFKEDKIKILPVKLREETLDAPEWLADKQYVHLSRLPKVEAIIDEVVKALGISK